MRERKTAMQDRDCSGYGVYESAGATMFQTALPAPAPNPLARLASLAPASPFATIVAPPPPSGLLTTGRAPMPMMFLKLGLPTAVALPAKSVAAPSFRLTFPFLPGRPGFRLVAQPVRRRVAVPIPVPRAAPPIAQAAAAALPPPPIVLPGQAPPMWTNGAVAPTQETADVLPGLPVLPGMPAVGFTQHGNLWMVDPAQIGLVSQLLGTMSYTPYDVPDVDSVGAHAAFMLGAIPGGTDAWSQVQLHTQQGFVSMVEKASVATGTLNIIVTQSPGTVAQLAGGPSAPFALITDQPAAMVDQADQILTAKPGPKETGTCPPGTTGAPPDCVAAGAQAAAMAAGAAPPGWWANLTSRERVVGVGALALVGLAFATRATGAPKRV